MRHARDGQEAVCAHGFGLGQRKVDEKSNEITAIPKLLDALELSGTVVTIDAMGCQRDIARKVIDKKADYVLALKGNQGSLREDVADSDEGGHRFQFDRGHHSNLMAAR